MILAFISICAIWIVTLIAFVVVCINLFKQKEVIKDEANEYSREESNAEDDES